MKHYDFILRNFDKIFQSGNLSTFTINFAFLGKGSGRGGGGGGLHSKQMRNLKNIHSLKGQSHEIFCTRFFPLTTPPGPIRDVLGPF